MRIIAAFAGCGKSHFCKRYEQAIDFICMPFKYRNFYELATEMQEKESIKAHDNLEMDWFWRQRYVEAIKDTGEQYPDEILVIPTDIMVLEILQDEKILFTMVYPEKDAVDVYRKRYIERGDSENFISIFADNWDNWMESLRKFKPDDSCRIVELRKEKYLSDVIMLDGYDKAKIIADKGNYIYRQYFWCCDDAGSNEHGR